MKLIGVAALLWSLSMNASAQNTDSLDLAAKASFASRFNVGLEAGYTRNFLISDLSILTSTQYVSQSGFSIGIPVTFQITNPENARRITVRVLAGLTLVKKNYQIARTGFYSGVNETFSNTYLQIPIMAQVSARFGRFSPFINAGGYAGYWMSGHVKGTLANILHPNEATTASTQVSSIFQENVAYSYSEKYSFNSARDNRIEIGLAAGLGVSYRLSDAFGLHLEGRVYQSLTDQQKNYMINQVARYNQTYLISAGCMVNLHNLRSVK